MLKSGAGFTFIETLVAIGILLALLAVVLANYRRGNDDSVLNREVSLMMSRVRYAQELTSAGTISKHCQAPHYNKQCSSDAECTSFPGTGLKGCQPKHCSLTTGTTCASDVDCPGGEKCISATLTPEGGYVMAFNCKPDYANYPWDYYANYPQIGLGPIPYFLFAERIDCKNDCYVRFNTSWVYDKSDGIISFYLANPFPPGANPKGETVVEIFKPSRQIVLRDIQLISGVDKYSCQTGSPWRNRTIAGKTIPADYPLQATVNFKTPDGRKSMLTDNISKTTPAGFEWTKLEVMLGIKNRTTDCRVVSITKDSVISQSLDENCSFSS